jgi:hypothetical protein
VTKAHELDVGVFVLDLGDELANFLDAAVFLDIAQHVQGGFVGAAVSRAPQAGHAGSDGCKRVGAG